MPDVDEEDVLEEDLRTMDILGGEASTPGEPGAASSSGGDPLPRAIPAPAIDPPEAPPDVPVEVRVREARAGPDGWWRLYLPPPHHESYIRLSTNATGAEDLRAVCGFCGIEKNRTCNPKPKGNMQQLGQGRPLATLWSFLKWVDPSKLNHCGLGGCKHKEFWPSAPDRLGARREVNELVPATSKFRRAERAPEPGVRDDPVTGEPYAIS